MQRRDGAHELSLVIVGSVRRTSCVAGCIKGTTGAVKLLDGV